MHIAPLRFGALEVPLWIPVTLFAAVMQTLRTGLQARLKGTLRASGAGFVRFLYALPLEFALLALAVLHWGPQSLPEGNLRFYFFCMAGGIAQILGTLFLVQSFHQRGFVAGTAYAKTEAAQLLIISVVLLGAHIAVLAMLGIVLALVGVLSLSQEASGWRPLLRGLAGPGARYGLGAAFGFALSALALRAASLQLHGPSPILLVGLWILIVTNTLQTLIQGGYLLLRQPAELRQVLRQWRQGWPVGVLSALGSWGWFTGFALTQVALVRGLGQIDTLLAFFLGHHFLQERLRRREIMAVLLIVAGALCILAPDLRWG